MAEFKEVNKQRLRMCEQYMRSGGITPTCTYCPLWGNDKMLPYCKFLEGDYVENEIIIMNWAKAHPVLSNRMKFKEVFGFEPNKNSQDCSGIPCTNAPSCANCERFNFWEQEYKEENKA